MMMSSTPVHLMCALFTAVSASTDIIIQFASYLAQEIQSGENNSSDEASDDEEDSGWLAHSTFDLRSPPVSARQHESERRPLSSSGFDVSHWTFTR